MKNILQDINSRLAGKRTIIVMVLVFASLFGTWQKWWSMPAEFYEALFAAGMVFLRLSVSRVESSLTPEPDKPTNEPSTPPGAIAIVILCAVIVVGCASPSAVTFRAEKLAVDSAHGALIVWRDYYKSATNGASPETISRLVGRTTEVNNAARGISDMVSTLEVLRVASVTNSVAKSQTLAASQAITACASNMVWMVNTFKK